HRPPSALCSFAAVARIEDARIEPPLQQLQTPTRQSKGRNMRSIAIAFLMLTTAASTVLADGQTHYAGSEEAEQAFWSELYISGGDTLYCASPFTGPDTNLVASAVYSVRQIRQSLRCATTNQCA